jgi:nitrous oxidase accessory protein
LIRANALSAAFKNNPDMRVFSLILLLACTVRTACAVAPLQNLIDATPAGSVLRPPAGVYAGPALIAKPLVLDGRGVVGVEGGGVVLTIRANGVTVRGVRLAGSGESHDQLHAGLLIEGDDNLIEDNTLEDVLFGIHVKQGMRNRILGNRVLGKDRPLAERGDGLRLWNSRHNQIRGNRFRRIRDLTFANSTVNTIADNELEDGRYGMQFVFSPRSVVIGNRLSRTGTGIVVLYSPGQTIRGNRVAHALDGGGGGLSFKESGDSVVEDNEVLHCSVGLQADTPLGDESVLTIRNNRFAHNVVGMYFYGERGGHRLTGNRIEHNLTQVAVSAPGAGAANVWSGNYWTDYRGFDRDGDGVGDTPHELWLFADRIWMETPWAGFFRNSPALEMLDLLERLAPFAAPSLIVRDPRPLMR